jgi:hypothetical protein
MRSILDKAALYSVIALIPSIGFGSYPIFFLVFIPLMSSWGVSTAIENRDFKRFLISMEGKQFFFINNRKGNEEFVIQSIFPHLREDIEILFVEGSTIQSDYHPLYISMALWKVKPKKGFPYLMKISNGKIHYLSVNNAFYNVKNNGKDVREFILQVEAFFDNQQTDSTI